MSQAKKNRSYYVILQLFRHKDSVSSEEIQKALAAEELPNSHRTVIRLRKELEEIGILLEYDHLLRKFSFKKEESDEQVKILNLLVAADFMREVALSPKDTLKYIDFDARIVTRGAEFLPEIFDAITKRFWIKVEYKRYECESSKTHLLAPLFLKEFNNRWYLLAVYKGELNGKKNTPLLFGIDRIRNVSVTSQPFDKDLFQSLQDYPLWAKDYKSKPMDLFSDIIGVRITAQPIQMVVLKFAPQQAPFVKSQPWHSTQEVLIDNESEFRIALYVRLNDDLLTMILSQHGTVEVLEPTCLRQQTIEALKKSLALYIDT